MHFATLATNNSLSAICKTSKLQLFLLTPYHCSDTIKSVLVFYSAVTARSDIPATEFPDYVRLMHQESDHRLDQEYKVSTNLKTLVIGVIVSIACRV